MIIWCDYVNHGDYNMSSVITMAICLQWWLSSCCCHDDPKAITAIINYIVVVMWCDGHITVITTSLSKIYQTTLIMGYLMKWWNCWHHGGDHTVDILQPAFPNTFPKYYVFGFWCLWITLLTLNERGPSYLGLTSSISWLLMSWLLSSPGHHQPWCWLCRISRSLAYWSQDFKCLCHINVEEWHKM